MHLLKKVINFLSHTPPRPHPFVELELKSSIFELINVINSIDAILPQLSQFIDQFNTLIQNTDINVITDADGTLSIDVPSSMPDKETEKLSKKIEIIDRLISIKENEIEKLIEKGSLIDNQLKSKDPDHNSEILAKIKEFERLKSKYKH